MQEIIIEIINQYGYIGVALLIAIENLFPPIPSEIILTFSGFMTTYTEMNVWGVIIAATIGSMAGALILYTIGRAFDTQRLERLFDSKLGRLLRLKKEDARIAERWFAKHGNKTVFFCRFIPIVRSLISIPAGAAKMRFSLFFILTIAGTLIWNVVLVFLGRIAGAAWMTVAHYFDVYSMIATVIFIAIIVVVGIVFFKKRFLDII